MRRPLQRLLAGSVAGFLATVPQTLAMELARLAMPTRRPGRFPPRQVVESLLAHATPTGRRPALGEPTWWAVTTACHFGYGAAAGTAYAALPTRWASTPVAGAAYGLGVWAVSYGLILPALGVRSPQADHPLRKNLQLALAHLAWGVATAALVERLTSPPAPDRPTVREPAPTALA